MITVADVLRHEGGLPVFSNQMNVEDSFPENVKNGGVGSIIETEEPDFPDKNTKYDV